MFKFAGAVVDFYDDPAFHENADAQALLGDVLVAPDQLNRVPDSGFAVKIATAAGVHRKFPIYNKASTALSGNYFDKIASALPEKIRQTAGGFLKEAHVRFALPLPESLKGEFTSGGSRFVEYEPEPDPVLSTANNLVKVAEYAFMDRHRSMHVLERVEKAYEISKVASTCGQHIEEQEVWDYVPKDTYGPLLKEALVQRETMVARDPMLKAAFAHLMDEFPKMASDMAPFVLFEFDKMAGLDARYGLNGVTDPFMAAWGGTFLPAKQAEVKTEIRDYKLATVARHKEILLEALPEKFVSAFIRNPKAAYESASPEQKKLIDNLMEKIPVGKDAKDRPSSRPSKDIPPRIKMTGPYVLDTEKATPAATDEGL